MRAPKSIILAFAAGWAFCTASGADAFSEADADGTGWYVGAAGGILLPGSGNSLRRAAEVSVRGGYCLSDYLAV